MAPFCTRKLQRLSQYILGISFCVSVLLLILPTLYWPAREYSPKDAVQPLRDLEEIKTSQNTVERTKSIQRDLNLSSEGLNVHIWLDLCGIQVHRLRQTPLFPRFPHQRLHVMDFKLTTKCIQCGQRIFGFVKPALSGYYEFAISSNDTSELWLSFDENSSKIRLIASVSSPDSSPWTVNGDYSKYPRSNKIFLKANTYFYIEALHKQGEWESHLTVYWKLPASSTFEIISKEYLYNGHLHMDSNYIHTTKNSSQAQILPDYYHLLLADEKEIDKVLPTCHYEPSFIVHRKLRRYQGVDLILRSLVFPEDNTAFPKSLESKTRTWSSGNELVDEKAARSLVSKFTENLKKEHLGKYSLQKIISVVQTIDKKKGRRFLLELQLGLRAHSNASVRLSRYVFLEKGGNGLCFPEGYKWHRNADIYFILPVKNQGGWLHHFISEMTRLYDKTRDDNFVVIVIDFASDDVDVARMIKSSPIAQKITLIRKSGPFHKTLAIQEAAKTVPSPRDIVFLFDLHIDVPFDLLESVRKHTIQGKMAYSPVVGRLECGRFRDDPDGFWQMDGFGIMAVYKSDWDRFGGMNVRDFTTKWGGEDWDLVDRILGVQLEILRLRQPGLLHYYHTHNKMWHP